ncbi:MAG TPA: carbohydrate ABC transporter permease [Nocardioidaceae bacterium]|nr:carbohydrate ABC transporter permease [Nocardioidaceae bacterium]
MTAVDSADPVARSDRRAVTVGARPRRWPRVLAYLTLIGATIGVLTPILWALYTSLRPFADTQEHGYFSLPHGGLTFDNYVDAWNQADLPKYFVNTLIIVIPSVIIVLGLSTFLAYALTRFSFKFNLALLMLFTAGNLLPQQVVITPLYLMYTKMWMPYSLSEDGYWVNSQAGVILIHVAFQMGFCTFVMSSYMKTIPTDLTEAALVDGAGVLNQFFRVILPLCRAPLAALATLEFTWIYNDFFWALVLLIGRGDLQPITTALNSLNGTYFTNDNLKAAGALMAAAPTIAVFVALQRYFVGGLQLGATKG